MYGSQTWTTKEAYAIRLEAFEMCVWRKLEKVKWTDKKTNEEVSNLVKEKRACAGRKNEGKTPKRKEKN